MLTASIESDRILSMDKEIPEGLKAHIPASLPMTPKEEGVIRRYCVSKGVKLGRLAVISMLEYIERDKR